MKQSTKTQKLSLSATNQHDTSLETSYVHHIWSLCGIVFTFNQMEYGCEQKMLFE